ncbi:MAG: DUF116 domain-containing protein [Methanosarcinales archaeon]|nr:DUF116 domain-containing protein [Methanosarcinales archaeon]
MPVPYELLGRLFVYLAVLVFLVTALALLIGAYSFRRHRIMFPNFVLFMLYLFYSPAKWICRVFYIKEALVDDILIEFRNALLLDRFKHVTERRAVILPQCMRHPECRARCDPIIGYECKQCGKCDIGRIVEAAEKYDFKVFVVPGGSFVRKILKVYKPGSCLGVACRTELTESMQEVAKIVPVQGVCLLRDGCYDTRADVDEVIRKMKMCDMGGAVDDGCAGKDGGEVAAIGGSVDEDGLADCEKDLNDADSDGFRGFQRMPKEARRSGDDV